MPPKLRADHLLVMRGLCASRTMAQSVILAGRVFSGERRIDKPGASLLEDTPLEVRSGPRFVSRGGDKLDSALTQLHVDVTGRTCLDVGASTGGFTDCLLQRGAKHVYAVDVGRGQLAPRLLGDTRVTNREGENARFLTAESFPERIDLVVVDASFIGLGKLLGALHAVVKHGGDVLAMVKPQFEAGRALAARNRGVIRDEALRMTIVDGVVQQVLDAGFELLGRTDSAVAGPKGNLEHFVWARALRPSEVPRCPE